MAASGQRFFHRTVAIAHSRRVELSGQLADGAAVQARWAGLEAALDGTGTGEPGSWRAEVDVGADWDWFALEAEGSTPVLTATLTRRGWHYVPPAAESITHDADGNLTADARWICKWDAENRLIEMTEKTGIPAHSGGIPAAVLPPPARRQLTFDYDAEGRRIAKVVREWDAAASGGAGAFSKLVKDQRFLYDGWNMTVELNHTSAAGTGLTGSTVQREYVWGPDLSGTMQGAGGVGGLLYVKSFSSSYSSSSSSSPATFAPCYDGNGNITGWARLDGGNGYLGLAARYDYDPFGNRVTAVEPRGEVCPFGFSTKYRDEETGDLYYGHRFYRPGWGRWPSRDPIEEEGFRMVHSMLNAEPLPEKDPRDRNPYAFVLNDSANTYDYLGLQPTLPPRWHGPGTDYDPAANPFDNSDGSWDCPMQCILKHVLGIAVSSAAVASGQPLVPKRFVTPGSAEGTSIVGKMTDAVLGDLEIPRSRTIVGCCKVSYTKSASRFVSRWIPIIGWVQLSVDAAKVSMCVCEECGEK